MSNIISIDLDKRCDECQRAGATESGLCLECLGKAFNPKARMKSANGRAAQQRLASMRQAARRDNS